jgi:GntR family transcriptional regulator, rspAB operon transcriptional repressor
MNAERRPTRAAAGESPAPRLAEVTLDRRLPLRDQIYEVIRGRIIIGELRPGQALNEFEIAKQLGVSRTPVREAVKRISDEGLIEVFAQNGTFVTKMSRSAIEEAYIIRNALELESVRRAAARMTREHKDALDDIIAMHQLAITRHRFADAIRLDDQFHRYIAEINGLSMLWRTVDISKAQMDRGRYLSIPRPGWGEVTIEQHKAIVAALTARKATAAVTAMRDHLNTSLQNTLKLLDEEFA